MTSRELSLVLLVYRFCHRAELDPDSPRDVIAALGLLGRALDELD